MTVAAVILAATEASALADADGTPAVRRLADAAWAGGATPVVVCAPDPDGRVAAALATTEATLVEPVDVEFGPAAQIANGIESALWLVGQTGAALVWPARLAWADAETVTTLIATHGEIPDAVLAPVYADEAGFPMLLPVGVLPALRALAPDRMPVDLGADLAAAGWQVTGVVTGDPGVTYDIDTPRSQLPAFDGPPQPDDDARREWGAAVADVADDAPVSGAARLSGRNRGGH